MSRIGNLVERAGQWVDRKRIQIHLRKTEEDLRKKNPDLSPEKERNREFLLDCLREYRERGEFPVNQDFASREPFFVSGDTPCAMAYLMQRDGEQDLVEKVAVENNNVYLEDVSEGPVMEWIQDSGLRKQEAERIQPAYGGYTVVNFASSCGPLACSTAFAALSLLGGAGFLTLEYFTYRHTRSLFPDKPLKQAFSLAGLSAVNFMTVLLGVMVLYALLP